eukprot:CAMPEP_0117065520 /NCGR_PEP_ID=MMETSP0472-20121206/45814_1 /TAXON_ID=693140 ORGANISM="Tiarina fusus, Strain LIS" /NCGR_SAMPLE_ID=MMETSP0472 /ASSEMBLY_ACC=CAM_ASM_000603 /LENGTH=56 /DNA_ID=CAMNT_0004786199 /DNA_START=31 /DNA_END=198 /DNA_ORIENTATION=-
MGDVMICLKHMALSSTRKRCDTEIWMCQWARGATPECQCGEERGRLARWNVKAVMK